MLINNENCQIINSAQIHFHDDIFIGFHFDLERHNLIVSIEKNNPNAGYFSQNIEFQDVVGIEMTSCNFWGISPHIFNFEYIMPCNSTLISKLYQLKNSDNFPCCTLKKPTDYIETTIHLTSGDKITVACERIVI